MRWLLLCVALSTGAASLAGCVLKFNEFEEIASPWKGQPVTRLFEYMGFPNEDSSIADGEEDGIDYANYVGPARTLTYHTGGPTMDCDLIVVVDQNNIIQDMRIEIADFFQNRCDAYTKLAKATKAANTAK